MTGLEIFLIVLLVIATAALVALAFRNAELKRNHSRLMGLLASPAQPLPQAAETVGFIKQANFDRATSWRDDRIAELARDLLVKEGEMHQLRDEARAAVAAVRAELDAERAERMRLSGMYASAESERQRLALENAQYTRERRAAVN